MTDPLGSEARVFLDAMRARADDLRRSAERIVSETQRLLNATDALLSRSRALLLADQPPRRDNGAPMVGAAGSPV
jgi:hypothetical protein